MDETRHRLTEAIRTVEGVHMRRFIVEVVLDALVLLFIALLLGIFSVGQPFPFGPDLGPDHPTARRRRHRVRVVGGDPGPGQPLRPAGPGRADRPPPVHDDGLLRRDHQRDRAVADLVHRPDQDRAGRRPDVAVDHPRRRPLHAALDAAGRGPRAQSAGPRRRPQPRHLGLPRIPSRRRAGTSIIENLRLQQVYDAIYTHKPRHRAGGHAGRCAPPLVRPRRPWRQGRSRSRPRVRSGSRRCSSNSARPT